MDNSFSAETPGDHFERGIEGLSSFNAREGHTNVPQTYVEGGFKVGAWVAARRAQYRAGELTPEAIARLEGVDSWEWKTTVESFEGGFAALREFALRESHTNVSLGHIEGYKLGKWVARRRAEYRKGELSQGTIETLESLPGWSWDPSADDFERGIATLTRFVEREGHACRSVNYVEDGFKLGEWIAVRRKKYIAGQLSDELVARLEAFPGWTWGPDTGSLDAGLTALAAFVAREGHTNVPPVHIENGIKLAMWMEARRAQHRAGELGLDTVTQLDDVPGFKWNASEEYSASVQKFAARTGTMSDGIDDEAFEKGFAALTALIAREKAAKAPNPHIENGFDLVKWTAARRSEFLPEQIARLEALSGWTWNPSAEKGAAAYERLERFVAREGHANVPWNHVEDGFRLGGWVSQRRELYEAGRITVAEMTGLGLLPGWTWDRKGRLK